MYNQTTTFFTCPKDHTYKSLETSYSEPGMCEKDIITKEDLICGSDCDVPVCPCVERHNSLRYQVCCAE